MEERSDEHKYMSEFIPDIEDVRDLDRQGGVI
jgi:hypothetical protein